MATTKKRRMVSLSDEVDVTLQHLAKRDDVPPSTKAAELIQLAIEIDEDEVWEEIVNSRDTKDAKFISHDEAWS